MIRVLIVLSILLANFISANILQIHKKIIPVSLLQIDKVVTKKIKR